MINKNNYREILAKYEGKIIKTQEFVEIFGTLENKKKYAETKKLQNTIKKSILKKACTYCEIQDIGRGNYKINKIRNVIAFRENNIVDKCYRDKIGIFYISKDKDMYIGLSSCGFQDSIRRLRYENKFYDMLKNGGSFGVLFVSDILDTNYLNEKKNEYIEKYKKDYNILNSKMNKTYNNTKYSKNDTDNYKNSQCIYGVYHNKKCIYVGETTNFSFRTNAHVSLINSKSHHCEKLNDFNVNDLEFKMLLELRVPFNEVQTKRILNYFESYYGNKFDSLYNIKEFSKIKSKKYKHIHKSFNNGDLYIENDVLYAKGFENYI